MIPLQVEKSEAEYLSDIGNMRYAYNGIVVLDIEGNNKDVRADPDSFTLGVSYAYRNGKADAPVTSGYLAFNHNEGNLSSAAMLCLRAALVRTDKCGPDSSNGTAALGGGSEKNLRVSGEVQSIPLPPLRVPTLNGPSIRRSPGASTLWIRTMTSKAGYAPR